MDPSHQLVATGLARQRSGDLSAAISCYEQALTIAPEHPDAWNLLGLVAMQQGAQQRAIHCISRAVSNAPSHAPFQINLGNALLDAGRTVEAESAFRRAVALDESLSWAWLRLGTCVESQRRFDEAIDCYRRATGSKDCAPEGWVALAELLARLDRLPEAREAYERLLRLRPTGRVWSNFGNVLLALGDRAAAIAAYRESIQLSPELAETHFNLGTALALQRQYDLAADEFRFALDHQPTLHVAATRLAECQRASGDLVGARASLDRVVAENPDRLLPRLRRELAWPEVWESNAEIDEYRGSLRRALTRFANEQFVFDVAELDGCGADPPALLAYQGRNDLEIKTAYAQLFAPGFSVQPLSRRDGKPRIGFVVTGGHEGIFLRGMGGLIARLDHRQLGVTVVCHHSGKSTIEAYLRNIPGGDRIEFVTGTSLMSLASAVQSAKFDLLYYWETGTDSTNYFLPFMRLAPVQCTSWGWPVTSGIPTIDYFVSSRWLEVADAQTHYSEQLVPLSEIPNYYERPTDAEQLRSGEQRQLHRERFGFRKEERIYLCPQNPLKIHPDFDCHVAKILNADDKATLIFLAAARPSVTRSLRNRIERRCGPMAARLRWLPRMGKADYRRLIVSADVALDTIHYGGGANTTYDALALGTPLVTLPGKFHRGRYASGVYHRMGLEQYVSTDDDSYVEAAVRMASNPDYRQTWRDDIDLRSGAIFSNLDAVREVEAWFLATIEEARAGKTPRTHVVHTQDG